MNLSLFGASLKIPSLWNPVSCIHSRSLIAISTCFYFWIDDLPRVTSAWINSNEQMCLFVNGCERQIPISPSMEFLNSCQDGTNALVYSRIMLTNNDAVVKFLNGLLLHL